jgi:ABC-type dipeptide/oligopeptide/nickel transport system permease subunit
MSSSIPASASPERRHRALGRLRRSRLALVGVAIVGLTALVGLVAPLFVTADPVGMDFAALLKGPSRAHLLGTDQFGRDVLARLVWGARLSVSIGAVAVALALVVGVPIGALSGYAGGAVDNVLMRCMDALLAFPALLLALGLVAIMGPGSTSTTLAIGIVYTPGVARLTRGVVLAERPQEYVQAAHALGQRDRWVLLRHIMPNCVSALLVQASVNFANAMVIEAGLSFLGIGTPPPTPSWGLMLNEARAFMSSAAHVAIAPGVAISLAVLGWNLLGDGLRDALDPRLTE